MHMKLLVFGSALAIAVGIAVYLIYSRLIVQGSSVPLSKVANAQTIPAHLSDQAGVREAVSAGNAFACDLYQQLAGSEDGGNVFFSPYSIAGALTLVAEGARGETAEQLGRAMRYPANLRQKGPEARISPWDTERINTGMAEFNREISGTYRPVPVDIRITTEALRKKLAEANKRIQESDSRGNYQEGIDLAAKARADADELNRLLSQVDQYELRVANTLWAERTYPLNQNYVNKMKRLYGAAAVIAADFIHDPEGMRQKINHAIEEQTHGQIREMVAKGGINEATRLALVNAVYFKGEWEEIFRKEETRDHDFFLLNGTKRTVPMMHGTFESVGYAAFKGNGTPFDTPQEVADDDVGNEKKLYPDAMGFLVLELTYKGGEISMVILVPRSINGFTALNKKLTLESIEKWIGSLRKREVEVFLPKFTLKTSYDLKRPLQSLGIVRMFKDPRFSGGAELGALCAGDDPDHRLFITDALHNACLEVNEEGTVAAAVTFFGAAAAAAPDIVPFTPVFRADKPFLFLIRHKKTNAILFIGRMARPDEKQ